MSSVSIALPSLTKPLNFVEATFNPVCYFTFMIATQLCSAKMKARPDVLERKRRQNVTRDASRGFSNFRPDWKTHNKIES